MSCVPELQNGKRYSFTTTQCMALGYDLTEAYLSFIGYKATTIFVMQKEENGAIRWDSYLYPEIKTLYKVSDATNETGDTSITTSSILLIVVVVVIVIVVIVVVAIILVFLSKRNQPAKKLPTQSTTKEQKQSTPVQPTTNQPASSA